MTTAATSRAKCSATIRWPGVSSRPSSRRRSSTPSPAPRRRGDAFQSPRVPPPSPRHTGAKIEGCYLRIEYGLDLDGFWLEPHTDLGVKALTLLVQLPGEGQAELGTDIYAGPGAW